MTNNGFLIAGIVMLLLVQGASATLTPSKITTNGTNVYVNGVDTFITSVIHMCKTSSWVPGETCGTSVAKNTGFDYDIGSRSNPYDSIWLNLNGGDRSNIKYLREGGKFKSYFFVENDAASGTYYTPLSTILTTNHSILYKDGVVGGLMFNDPSFFGYHVDEPDTSALYVTTDVVAKLYNQIKAVDINHPVIVNLCCQENIAKSGFDVWKNHTDIVSWDHYAYSEFWRIRAYGSASANVNDAVYSLPDFLYGWQYYAYHKVFKSANFDLDAFGKPVFAIIQAMNVTESGDKGPTSVAQVRAMAYLGISMGVDGLNFWSYGSSQGDPSPSPSGFAGNSLYNLAGQNLAREIKNLSYIFLTPRTAYSWAFDWDNTSVSFTNDATTHDIIVVKSGVPDKEFRRFDYRLWYNSSTNKYYLLAINKDSTAVTTTIKIPAISGTWIARTIGEQGVGVGLPGRTINLNNGVFESETFDAYGVVIYEISSINSAQNSAPVINTWGNTKTNNSSVYLTLNASESVMFNATANQSITTWKWYKDGVLADNNLSSYISSWDSSGNKSIKVYGTKSNSTTNTITWTITVNPVPPVLTSITVSPTSATLTAGANQVFIATAFNGTNRMPGVNISWKSSNTTVGTVNQLFAITGADGNASVTFSSSVSGTSFVNATNGSVKGTAFVAVNPVNSPKFGLGGATWDSVGTSLNVYIEDNKLKLGFWGENFDDGLYEWTTDSGTISVSNGKLLMSSSINAIASKVIGNHSNVSFFAEWNEPVTTSSRAFSIRSDTSSSNKAMNYYASARSDGLRMWIVKYNGSAWVNLNETGTFARTNGSTSYCIEKGYGTTFKVYCSHTSYADALANPPVSRGTDTQFAYGNRIRLEGNSNTTWDNLRIVLTDASGNLINSGNKTVYYDAGANNQSNGIIINALTSTNTNYTVSYRQKNVGAWIPIGGVYTGNKTLPITGTKYQNTEINITLFGDGISFPEIETVEFTREQVSTAITYPRYDVNEDGIININDLTLVCQYINEVVPFPFPRYDVNMDGLVNIMDLSIVGKHFGEHL